MNTDCEPMDTALRWQLRALRQDIEPPRNLWPSIAAHLNTSARTRRTPRWMLPLGLAAVLALAAFGLHGPLRPPAPNADTITVTLPESGLIQAQIELLVHEYQTALDAIHAHHPVPEDATLALLDASADHIRAALAQDPHVYFLLSQLHRVYARRLALTRQLSAA